MNVLKISVWGGVAAVAAILIVSWLWQDGGRHRGLYPAGKRGQVNAPSSSTEPANTAPFLQVPARSDSSASPVNAAKSAAFLRKYESAIDLRPYVELMKQRPKEGGVYYALLAMQECANGAWLSDSPKDQQALQRHFSKSNDHRIAQAQLAAETRLRSRCSGFTKSEVSSETYRQLLRQGEEMGDPLITAKMNFLRARESKDGARTSAAMQRVFELQDPQVLSDIGATISTVRATKGNGVAYVFDGQRYEGKASVIYGLAWSLVPCAFGAPCDGPLGNSGAAMMCIGQGNCFSNQFDAVRYGTLQGDEAAFGEVMALYKRLTEAIRSNNVAAFQPS
jgi:hypothetical protein